MMDDGLVALSNGAKIYVGASPVKWDEWCIEFIERMIAAGHNPILDEDGVVDFFVVESGYHNGPGCSNCSERVCMHCEPDYQWKQCPKGNNQ